MCRRRPGETPSPDRSAARDSHAWRSSLVAGFTLLEVLVAFVIMSLFLSVLVPQQAFLFERVVSDAERLLAQDYAFSVIEPLGVTHGLSPGRSVDVFEEWTIVKNIEPFRSNEAQLSEVWAIRVVVRGSDGTLLSRVETLRAR